MYYKSEESEKNEGHYDNEFALINAKPQDQVTNKHKSLYIKPANVLDFNKSINPTIEKL
jgi:hypothetical protein